MKQVAAGDDCAVRAHQQRSEAADLLGYADVPRPRTANPSGCKNYIIDRRAAIYGVFF
ncbi:hypothetical protein [Ralstonia solanacearum]|uniref:hypothetical protein n=1 Tax=Ralstonia solanacearum TaxID=305 RepID=UPI0018D0B57C|nr:hypothetical protein [Ralstonia solanacearum]